MPLIRELKTKRRYLCIKSKRIAFVLCLLVAFLFVFFTNILVQKKDRRTIILYLNCRMQEECFLKK